MYFAKYGSGKKIFVGLHGWSGDHRTFTPLVPHLPDDITFYSADLPGNGKSPAPEEFTLKRVVSEIVEELRSLNHSNMTIVGSCSGGLLGLFVVKRLLEIGQSRILKQLIIIDPFAYFPWYFKVFVDPRLGKIGWYAYYTTFANPIGRWITNSSLHKHRVKGTHLTDSFTETNHRVTYRYLQLLAEGGDAIQFSCISIPVIIVYGEKTFGAVRNSVSRWREILPQLTCYELRGVAHLPIEESSTELAKLLFQSK